VGGNVVARRSSPRDSPAPPISTPPSAAGQGYDAVHSGGTNLGPTSKKLIGDVMQRVADYRAENVLPPDVRVPADAVTSSASGLDPTSALRTRCIRRAGSRRPRIDERGGPEESACPRGRPDPRDSRGAAVNVLMLNLDLDGNL